MDASNPQQQEMEAEGNYEQIGKDGTKDAEVRENGNVVDEKNNEMGHEMRSRDQDEISDIEDDGEGLQDVEDIWCGEDPSEVEVEKFCLPSENSILEDLNIHLKKKKLFVYPMKLMDLAHPTMIECLEKCSDFKTTYLQNNDINSGSNSWNGLIELTFKTPIYAMEALDALKSIRDDIIVRMFETDESATRKVLDKWISDHATVCSSVPRNVRNMLVLRRLTENVRASRLKPFFPESLDIVISKESLKSQSSDWNPGKMAYVFFNSEDDLNAAVKRCSEENVVVDGKQLKLILYRPPNFPYGLIKMKRRYRILRQIRELKKILKSREVLLNETSKYKIRMSIDQCKLTLEKDNKARQELGLPLHSLSYLNRIPAIRESIPPDFDWMPQISFRTEDDDDKFLGRRDNRRRSKRGKRVNNGWMDSSSRRKDLPSRSGSYNQIARVHEIAAKIAQIASNMGSKARLDQKQPERGQTPVRGPASQDGSEFESNKRQRSPEPQNTQSGDNCKKIAKSEEGNLSANQLRDNIKPLMSMQESVGWNNRGQQRLANFGNQRGGFSSHFGQGYNMMNQGSSFGNANYNQSGYNQFPQRQQGPQGNSYYNYSQTYNARYPYPGYGYPPNVWGPDQGTSWSPQQNNYPWHNQS